MSASERNSLWRNEQNELVLWQLPNQWVWIAAISWLTVRLFELPDWLEITGYFIFYAAAGYWAYLEIISGDSTFRRWLGAGVALLLIVSMVRRFL